MKTIIIFPSDYFNKRKPDNELCGEYNSALSAGFDVVIFSYDDWFSNRKLVLDFIPENNVQAIYRGWMMKPKLYESFYYELKKKNIKLINTPDMYNKLHIFPNVYPFIEEDTAKTLIYDDISNVKIADIPFEKFIIKDFVKSVKGTDFPPYFEKDTPQEFFDKEMEKFFNYRGALLTGGICIKEFLNLKRYGEKTNEFRVFYFKNMVLSYSRNSGQGDYAEKPPEILLEKYSHLNSDYYTVDYAELADGSWKIIETGDGQVSGLSDNQNYDNYFKRLYRMINLFWDLYYHHKFFCS